jgi:hypothetical protein
MISASVPNLMTWIRHSTSRALSNAKRVLRGASHDASDLRKFE